MLVRKLTTADLASYRDLHRHGLRHSPDSFVETIAYDDERPDSEITAILEHGEGWGVFEGERLLGKLLIDRLPFPMLVHTRWLHVIYVHPDARGTGAAAALIGAAIDDARRAGAFRFLLWVNDENKAARRFYEKLGFEEIGRVDQGLAAGASFVDDVLMLLRTEPI